MAVLALLAVGVTPAAAGERSTTRGPRLDRTFGQGRGFVTTPIPGSFALAYAAVVLRDGDIVVAGQASPPSGNGQVVVVRYLPNGQLDPSFASHGIFESAFPSVNGPYIATAIAQDRRTGKLVIAGGYGQGSMLVMRLTADGRLDSTFGARRSGFATVAVGGIANSLAIQSDGGIVLGGSNANRNGRPFVVARFTRNGMLDRAFGRAGDRSSVVLERVGCLERRREQLGHGARRGHCRVRAYRLHRWDGTRQRWLRSRWHLPAHQAGPTVPSVRGGGPHAGQVPRAGRACRESWYPCAMTVDQHGRITVTGGGGTHTSALLTARLTPRGALDRSYGSARNGRSVIAGVGGNAITTCGDASTRTGEITVAVQSTLAQVLPSGLPMSASRPEECSPSPSRGTCSSIRSCA